MNARFGRFATFDFSTPKNFVRQKFRIENKVFDQFGEVLKNLGLGFLVILPFSPVTIPFLFKKAQELNIDLVPNWYKALSKSDDRLE